jgi:TP901 family phage tail tape measure protein
MADDRKITIEIEAKDYASSVFRSVTSGLNTFAVTANNGIYRANNALRSYNNTMRGFNSTVQRALWDAGRAVYNFTTDAIKQFAELEKQHAKTMGAMSSNYNLNTATGLQQFNTNSRALMDQAIYMGYNGVNGKGSLHSPHEISAAQTALIKAGISEKDILNTNALTDVIKFAGANDLSLDRAVEFAVQLGTQFNYNPSEWGGMLDQVTYAANASIIDVDDIIESMKYAGNMAAGYDQPLHEILAAIAVMGQSGLKGSQAGTGIQAIFSRGMSPTGVTTAGLPPTENVEEIYNGFVSKVLDENGNFLGIGNFADVLEQETSGLSDQETSWFYKKLFGMFQQKAGLALAGTDEGEMSYDDYVDAILENAAGTNDKVYELALESTYGSLEMVENAWLAFKTEFGDDLSPITKEVAQQLRNALVTKDFDFDIDMFREKVEEAGELLAEDFGEDVANAFTDVGNFLADAIDIGLTEAPLITGSLEALIKLLNGDFDGGWQTFKDGIEGVNDNIDDLPPELQDGATAIRNLILIFEGLFALNIVTRVAEGVTSFIRLFTGNKILSTGAKVQAATSTISAGNITNMTTGSISNATVASMMANTNTMTVYATVVNVIGGGGSGMNPGTGGGGVPQLPSGGGVPSLGGGGGSLLLPGAAAAGGAALGSGLFGKTPALQSGGSTPMLPSGSSAAGGAAAGKAINMYWNPVTKSYMTAGDLAKSLAVPALKLTALAGMAYVGASIPEENQPLAAYQYGFGTDYANYLGDDYLSTSGLSFGEVLKELLGNGGRWYDDMRNVKVQNFMKDEVEPATPSEYREARDELFNTIDGFKDYDAGKQYLSGVLDRWYWENSEGDKEFISQDQYVALAAALVEAMNQYMVDNNITEVSKNALGGPDAGGVPGLGTDIYQSVLDAMLTGLQGEDKASEEAMASAATEMSAASISLSDAVSMLVQNPSFVLGLNKGPMNAQGAYDYIMGQFSSPAGIAANQGLLEQINAGIAAIDPEVTVDITNPAPVVNVDVDVNVDKSGNVTKNVIQSYTGVDNWMYRYSQRNGSGRPIK